MEDTKSREADLIRSFEEKIEELTLELHMLESAGESVESSQQTLSKWDNQSKGGGGKEVPIEEQQQEAINKVCQQLERELGNC